jgi:argininosuccinate lyase
LSTPSRSGVFDSGADRRVEQFTESISYDRRLYAHDIAGSIAHAEMLAEVGLISASESADIARVLGDIRQRIEQGQFEFKTELEDIHMHIEKALTDELGDAGRKLHTARSRNDQVATAFKLWIRDALDRVDGLLRTLQRAWVGRCQADSELILPGYTHIQRAQPVLAAHYYLAYVEKLERDRGRIADCRKRLNVSPLGAGALAGTSLPIKREITAKKLGFESIAANSLDVSSDRDFAVEAAFALTLIAEHLSGWAEEWIWWSTSEFRFLKLPHAFCTGSSMMPQKINPDVLELIRGKSARVIGNLQSLLVLIKGLPLAYNRDLQEDKERLFDSFDTVEACLSLSAPLVSGANFDRASIESRLDEGYLDATTFMEYLILRGLPQRRAHDLVGSLVGEAMRRRIPLAQLPLEVFRDADASLDGEVYSVLGVQASVKSFRSYGSTAPSEVAAQVKRWEAVLAEASGGSPQAK